MHKLALILKIYFNKFEIVFKLYGYYKILFKIIIIIILLCISRCVSVSIITGPEQPSTSTAKHTSTHASPPEPPQTLPAAPVRHPPLPLLNLSLFVFLKKMNLASIFKSVINSILQ